MGMVRLVLKILRQRVKPSRTLWGSWAQKPFYAPHLLITGNRPHSASVTSPEF